MATGKITVDEGATTNLATNSFTEDAVTKHVSRSVLNNSSGTEIGTNANPVQVGDGGGSLTVDGSVSLSAVTPGTGASNLGKAEDAAHASGDVGVMALSVRQDTAAALSGTDADYQPLITDASGRLHVNVGNTVTVGSHAVTNAGTFVVQENGAALTALQLLDNIVYTEGDTDASISGAAILWEDGSDTLRAVSSAKPLPVNIVAGGAGDGAILDGVSSSIKATVLDYTNSNPVAVRLSDTNGDYVAAGAGTQYTEDVAAAADPIGGMVMAVRADSLAAVTTTDGDNIAARATNKGEIYVKHVDSIPVTNTGTFAVQAAQSGTWNITNVSGTVSLPTGASTLAEQQTQTTHLATIAGDTTDIEAAVELIDDTVVVLGTDTYTEASSKGLVVGAVRRDADTTLVNTTNEFGPLQMDANGRLKVEAFSGETLPVSLTSTTITGTVAVTQSGTWDEVGINDSGNSITVDNGGTFAVQVDGAALTALQLIDDPVATLGTTTYSEATTKGMIIGAVRRDADTTLVDTTNEISPLQVDANGRLKVEAFSGETLPVSLASVPSHAVTNAGTFAVQVDGNALTSLQLIDDTVFTDDAAFTPGTSKVLGIGLQADETSTDSVDEGDIGAPRMTLDRKVIVTNQPHSAGGCSIFRSLDLDETEEDVKTSAGCVYGMWVTNTATSTRWIKFYNATAANVTVGSTTPVITWGIPGNSSDDISGLTGSGVGIFFDTAICVAATTGVADADTGAPAANDVIINVFYK